MGYFSNGFVFTTMPDFDAASSVVPERSARGYKHNHHSVWLLDLWEPRGRFGLRRWPFTDRIAKRFHADLAGVDVATRMFLATLEQLQHALMISHTEELRYVHLGLAMAAATGCATYVYAADDEDLDIACNTLPRSLASFGCRLDCLSVQYAGGQTTITPLSEFEDVDGEGTQKLIEAVQPIIGISVLGRRDIQDGHVLYYNPVYQWPSAAGNPAEILGLGTWDPFLNLENDFTVVFEKLLD